MRSMLFLGLLALAGSALTGCSGTGGGLGGLLPVAAHDEDPWRIADRSFPSQRLYRVQYQGPEGDASFRLTLYLLDRERYRLEASDPLGRRVWSLDVGDEALWLDHRGDAFCRVASARHQTFVPIAHLPLVNLPRLLLGRMPADPFVDVRREGGKVSYVDASGQTWSGEVDVDGRLAWWTLVQGGDAVAWWKRAGDEQIFSDRRGGQQVRWREQIREPLARRLDPLEVPSDYAEGVCGDTIQSRSLAGR